MFKILFRRAVSSSSSLKIKVHRTLLCRNLSVDVRSDFLPRGENKRIAYKQMQGENPGIIFCPGFQSTMLGVKANALEEYCRRKDLSFVRFDYQGCGESPGDLAEMTLTDWKQDLLAILDQITAGPQILVGSSMGGLLMLYTALERPHRIHALVGIATALDFPRRGFSAYPKEIQEDIKKHGAAILTKNDMSYIISQKLLDDLPNHDILSQYDEINIKCPVHILHGMQDDSVPYSLAIELAEKLSTRDVQVVFNKNGEHRFSQPEDVQLLFETLDLLIFGLKDIHDLAIESWSSFTLFPQPAHLVTKKKLIKKY